MGAISTHRHLEMAPPIFSQAGHLRHKGGVRSPGTPGGHASNGGLQKPLEILAGLWYSLQFPLSLAYWWRGHRP
jgi:hypothetical protein